MSSVSDTINTLKKKMKDVTTNNIITGDAADRFKFFYEELDNVDFLDFHQPVLVLTEEMGTSAFFRFDVDRFDYGRFGDVGGMDELEVGI
jgi:hypothetical protein